MNILPSGSDAFFILQCPPPPRRRQPRRHRRHPPRPPPRRLRRPRRRHGLCRHPPPPHTHLHSERKQIRNGSRQVSFLIVSRLTIVALRRMLCDMRPRRVRNLCFPAFFCVCVCLLAVCHLCLSSHYLKCARERGESVVGIIEYGLI